MHPEKTSRSKSTSKLSGSQREKKALRGIQSIQSEVLAPIYDKVDILRREMLSKQPTKNILLQEQFIKPEVSHNTLYLSIDRDAEIERQRKQNEAQNLTDHCDKDKNPQKKRATTSNDWRLSHRNKTKSLINFLQNNKNVPKKFQPQKQDVKKSRASVLQKQFQNQEAFEPVGRLYQQSIRGSQSRTLSSLRPQSSLHLSKIGSANAKDSPKKYLRKGTRVRQILMRQLQSPQQRSGTPSTLTYLKQYDQWVPTTLVSQKRAQLQAFMSIMYGDKKDKGSNLVDLNQINLIYL